MVNLSCQRIHLGLQITAILGAVGVVCSLHRNFTHALQDSFDFLVPTFRGVDQRLAVQGVADRLVRAANFRA